MVWTVLLETPSFFDHFRGVLVLIHVVAVVGMSLPSPEGFATKAGRAKIESQLKPWESSVEKLGISSNTFRAVVFGGGMMLEKTEDRFERTFRWYPKYFGVRQSWRMFSTSPAKRWKLVISLERAGAWAVIYEPFSQEHRWRATLLEDGRVRGMLNAMGQDALQKQWNDLAKRLSVQARSDFPDATAVRFQQVAVTIPEPGNLRKSGRLIEGKARHEVTISLAEVAP